jgi:FG-GAP-like repeat
MKVCADRLLAPSSLLALAVLAAGTRAGGGILFAPGQVYLHGYGCEGLALTDLDLDGQLDLLYLTAFAGDWSLEARRGLSGRLWQDPVTEFLSSVDLPRALVAADFDGDGLPGAAVLQPWNVFVTPQLFVWHDADVASWPGLKSPPTVYPLGGSTFPGGELAATDFDVDGDVDLLVAQANQVISWKNTGGTFAASAATFVPGNEAVSVRLADLDGDGAPDMVDAASSPTPIVEVRLGLGTGSFADTSQTLAVDVWTWDSLGLADVDGDGAIDVVLGTEFGTLCARGDGIAGFLEPQAVSATPGRRLVVDDLDADGAPDILTAGLDFVRTLEGAGDGTFADGAVVPLKAPIDHLLTGDVNGDGRRDAVLHEPRGVLVLENLGDGSFPVRTDLPCPMAGIAPLTVPVGSDVDSDGDQDILVGNSTVVQRFTNSGGAWDGPDSLQAVPVALARVLAADLDGVAGVDVLGVGSSPALFTWRQLPGGGFAAPVKIALDSVPTDAQLADLDLDGDLDAIVAASPPVRLLNDGAGGWAAPDALPWSAHRVALPDLDADGTPDLALRFGNEIRVCEGVGDGGFIVRFAGTFSGLGGDLRAGNANPDGLLDLVTSRSSGALMLINHTDFQFGFTVSAFGEPTHSYDDVRLAELDGQPGDELLLIGSGSGSGNNGRFCALVMERVGGVWQRQGRYLLPSLAEGADLADFESDGDPDIVTSGAEGGTSLVSILPGRRSDPWKGLGAGLAGTYGPPELSGSGTLAPSSPIGLHVVKAREASPVVLVVGLGAVNLPFKGGTLVPAPDVLFVGFATDASGSLHLLATTPSAVPPGFEFVLQMWITDVDGPQGFAVSNGLRAVLP